jgi:hypothetical protein
MCIVFSSVVHRDLVPITCHHLEIQFGNRGSIRFLSLEVDRAAGTVGGMDPLRRWALRGGLGESGVKLGSWLSGSSVGMNRVALLSKGIRPGIKPPAQG